MAKMQNKYPSPCKQATGGKLGSKFLSVLVTGGFFFFVFVCLFYYCLLKMRSYFEGTEQGTVELQVYQASDQCMALVKDGIITASKDSKFMRVKKLKNRYIPDVMYNAKDEYNNEVLRKANPNMPLEFFIIRVSHLVVLL
jgi:nuclear protein localization family protein 4